MRHLFTFLLVGAFASSCIKTDLPAIIPTVTNPAADMNFSIKIIFNDSNASGYILDKYHDEGTFELDVKNNLVSVPQDKIRNFVPTDTPVSFVYGNTKVDYLVDSFGVINVVDAKGFLLPDSLNSINRIVALMIEHTKTVTPSFRTTYIPTGNISFVVGDSVPGYPQAISFKYIDSTQVIDPAKGTDLEGQETITITPIH
jgi:hypothetical protein